MRRQTAVRFRLRSAILPKNYDSTETPDAERWLPRRERSYYRGKRRDKRKEIGKGRVARWQWKEAGREAGREGGSEGRK